MCIALVKQRKDHNLSPGLSSRRTGESEGTRLHQQESGFHGRLNSRYAAPAHACQGRQVCVVSESASHLISTGSTNCTMGLRTRQLTSE